MTSNIQVGIILADLRNTLDKLGSRFLVEPGLDFHLGQSRRPGRWRQIVKFRQGIASRSLIAWERYGALRDVPAEYHPRAHVENDEQDPRPAIPLRGADSRTIEAQSVTCLARSLDAPDLCLDDTAQDHWARHGGWINSSCFDHVAGQLGDRRIGVGANDLTNNGLKSVHDLPFGRSSPSGRA